MTEDANLKDNVQGLSSVKTKWVSWHPLINQWSTASAACWLIFDVIESGEDKPWRERETSLMLVAPFTHDALSFRPIPVCDLQPGLLSSHASDKPHQSSLGREPKPLISAAPEFEWALTPAKTNWTEAENPPGFFKADHTALVRGLALARLATHSSHWLLLGVKTSSDAAFDPTFWKILGRFNWFAWWSLDIYLTQSKNINFYSCVLSWEVDLKFSFDKKNSLVVT